MGMINNGELGLQESSMGLLSSQFPEVYLDTGRETNSLMPVSKAEQYVVTEWDPLVVPTAQSCDFSGALSLPAFDYCVMGNQGIHCSSVGMAGDMSTIPCYAGVGLSQFISRDQADLTHNYDRNAAEDVSGKKRKNFPVCSGLSSSSSFIRGQNTDPEKPNGKLLAGALRVSETKDGKRQRSEHNSGGNARKPSSKLIKEQEQSGGDRKGDYIHVRAKRGQATNSHSLAERVRREKISERMRFLQNLVPGCNKITGKAVMLDEIINYVQSLQRQVEFLSMKLATVHPEMNFDIVQLLAKNMLHSRSGCSQPFSFGPGMDSMCHSNAFVPQPAIQTEMLFNRASNPQEMMRNCSNQIPPVDLTNSWDDELHNAIQMGFNTHMSVGLGDAEPPGNQD